MATIYVINGGKMWITNGVQATGSACSPTPADDQVFNRNKSLILRAD